MSRNYFDIRIKPMNVWGTSKNTKKRQLTNAQKVFAWENKSHGCNICGKQVIKFSDAEFDHTRAHSKSGATNLSNVKIVHRQCNRIKGKKSLSETKKLLGIKLKIKKRKITKKKLTKQKQINPFGQQINIPSFKF